MFKLLTIGLAISLTLSGCFLWQPKEAPSDTVTATHPEILQASYARDGIFAVSNAVLDNIGYVVVYRANSAGGTGKTVGISRILPSGENRDLKIATGDLESGHTYIALIHLDNGDKIYRTKEDAPQYKNTQIIKTTVVAD